MAAIRLTVIGGIVLFCLVPSKVSAKERAPISYRLGISGSLGGMDAGELHGTSVGFGVVGLVRIETFRFSLEAESAGASLSSDESENSQRGRTMRFRLLAHIPLLEVNLKRYEVALALSGGIGGEWIDFERNDSVRRDLITWGFDSLGGLATRRIGDQVIDLDFAYRFDIGRAPASKHGRRASCSGPCDVATSTQIIDLSLTFLLKLQWGPRP